MPIIRCVSNKKKGYKFGKSGKCYIGRSARKKARKQGQAISISKTKKIKVKGSRKRRATLRRL